MITSPTYHHVPRSRITYQNVSSGMFAFQMMKYCANVRSEEHTSELQSRSDLVCRLLLEKKKKKNKPHNWHIENACDKQKRLKIGRAGMRTPPDQRRQTDLIMTILTADDVQQVTQPG